MSDTGKRIRLDNIHEDGLELSAGLGDAWACEAARDSLEGEPEELHFDMRVTVVSGYVRVTGHGRAAVPRVCDRCEEPLRLEVEGDMDLFFSPPTDLGSDSVLLSKDDLDVGFFDGVAIDLVDVLGEQLALWAPSRVRCGDRQVKQVGAPHPCEMPVFSDALAPEPELHPKSPFANLRLPK